MEIKDTILLPKTDFSMKADLPKKEPAILESWMKNEIYQKLRKTSEEKEKFIKGPFAASNVNALLATWSEQIRPVVKEAQNKNTWDQLTVQEWESKLYELMDQLEFARNKK